jgi:hypothetical protein
MAVVCTLLLLFDVVTDSMHSFFEIHECSNIAVVHFCHIAVSYGPGNVHATPDRACKEALSESGIRTEKTQTHAHATY